MTNMNDQWGSADLRAEIFSKLVRDSELGDVFKVVTDLKQSLLLLSWKTTIANLRKEV